jgi:hypothetical protein
MSVPAIAGQRAGNERCRRSRGSRERAHEEQAWAEFLELLRKPPQERMQCRHDCDVGGQGWNWGGLRYESRMNTSKTPGLGEAS